MLKWLYVESERVKWFLGFGERLVSLNEIRVIRERWEIQFRHVEFGVFLGHADACI